MSRRITELEQQLQQSTDALPEEIDALNELAYELRSLDAPRAFTLATQAMQAAESCSYQRGIARSILNKGILACQDSQTDAAMQTLLEAQSLCMELQDQWGLAASLRWIGVLYTRIGSHVVALEYFLKSYTMSKELADARHTAACLINIGGVHSVLGDQSSALQCFSEAFDLSDSLLDRATLLWNIGRACEGLGDYDKALEHFQESLSLRKQTGDYTGASASLFAIGDIYRKTDQPCKALRHYLLAHHRCVSTGYRWGESLTNHGLGAFYRAYHRPEKAIPYLQAAITIAENINNREVLYQAHRELSECYSNAGNTDLAFYHFRQYHMIKEEMSSKQLLQTITYLRYGYESENKKHESEIYRLRNVELVQAYEKVAEAYEEVKILNDHLVQANHSLIEVNEEKNELLGIVAHDLKNPLSTIVLSSSLVRQRMNILDTEDIGRYMSRIENTALNMSESIDALLDLNAIETGGMSIASEDVYLEETVEHVVDEYRERAGAKSIMLHVECLCQRSLITADKKALHHILDNLISNAVKYSPYGKNVFVRLTGSEHTVRCEVQDEGPGLTEEDQRKLFGKFARLSARPTGGEHSTGLGLSIVKRLVEAMQGRVWCESVAGQGATFIIEFPLLQL